MARDFVLEWIEQLLTGHQEEQAQKGARLIASERLGELWPLLLAASVIADPIDLDVLARMLRVEKSRLMVAAGAAAAQGRLTITNGDDRAFCNLSASARAIASELLPEPAGREFNRRAGEAIVGLSGTPTVASMTVAARHFELARAWQPALRWRRAAADLAALAGDAALALINFEKACAICGPDGHAPSPDDELAVLGRMGPLVAQLEGSGSGRVSAIYARCLEIAEGYGVVRTRDSFRCSLGLERLHPRSRTRRDGAGSEPEAGCGVSGSRE